MEIKVPLTKKNMNEWIKMAQKNVAHSQLSTIDYLYWVDKIH